MIDALLNTSLGWGLLVVAGLLQLLAVWVGALVASIDDVSFDKAVFCTIASLVAALILAVLSPWLLAVHFVVLVAIIINQFQTGLPQALVAAVVAWAITGVGFYGTLLAVGFPNNAGEFSQLDEEILREEATALTRGDFTTDGGFPSEDLAAATALHQRRGGCPSLTPWTAAGANALQTPHANALVALAHGVGQAQRCEP
ncbi:MAG: hypothetical protein ACFCBW_07605 [Candidatus Competibacterales bacterium]